MAEVRMTMAEVMASGDIDRARVAARALLDLVADDPERAFPVLGTLPR